VVSARSGLDLIEATSWSSGRLENPVRTTITAGSDVATCSAESVTKLPGVSPERLLPPARVTSALT